MLSGSSSNCAVDLERLSSLASKCVNKVLDVVQFSVEMSIAFSISFYWMMRKKEFNELRKCFSSLIQQIL